MSGIIYTDMRCLQDAAYRWRGIGYHTSALLRARRGSRFVSWKTIGLVDPTMPSLYPEFTSLVDEISFSANPCRGASLRIFIDGSPMTHDPRFGIRFQKDESSIRAAVLYDFIPIDWPGYLPTVTSRIAYLARLARLKDFDLFFPISDYTASRLSELVGANHDDVRVTGACVRRSLYELRDRLNVTTSPYDHPSPYFVTLGGDDTRKNTDIAVTAVRDLNLRNSTSVPLKVIGHYGTRYKLDLLRLAGHAEGDGFLEFFSYITDEEVVSLHAGAIAAIAPSHIEGFSLPVAEAAVCGCPVVASTCDAQIELVNQSEALFSANDTFELSNKLAALLHDPALRASLVSSQAHLGSKFHEDAVASRFWSAIEKAVESRRGSSVAARPWKPRLAFLSPNPDGLSATSSSTPLVMEAGREWFDSDIYIDFARPLKARKKLRDSAAISLAPFLDRRCEGIISILGNSSSYTRIFEVFERYGGPCILDDVRLTHVYFERLGPEPFRGFAQELLSKEVSLTEIHAWLQDFNPPSLFVERVIKRASPLMVRTESQRDLLKKRYGVDAHVLTCFPTVLFDEEELTASVRTQIRRRLGIPLDTFLISSFGCASQTNGTDACIFAVELLRYWKIPAELYLVGDSAAYQGEAERLSALLDVAEHIHYGGEYSDDGAYRDLLIASDAAVHLRPVEFGSPSVSLINAISAGLPVVANSECVKSCDAQDYASLVPDSFSPLLVAEQLARLWGARTGRDLNTESRMSYLQTHNARYFAKRLAETLQIA
jgi:glycosyltransferase involved in cell wall biosynthesis